MEYQFVFVAIYLSYAHANLDFYLPEDEVFKLFGKLNTNFLSCTYDYIQ